MSNAKKAFLRVAYLVAVTVVGFSSLAFGQTTGVGQFARVASNRAYVSDEVLVAFKSDTSAQARRDIMTSFGDHGLGAPFGSRGITRVKLAAGATVAQAVARYRAMGDVAMVQPNYIYRALAVPNDTDYGQLWAFKNIGQAVVGGTYPVAPSPAGTPGDDMNMEPAWDLITDCSAVLIAIVDTGVNYNQQDLAANMWTGMPNHGFDFVDSDDDPLDLNGHGTHVAGIAGAVGNNNQGTTGVCWKASIMAVRVLDAAGVGTTADIIQGIDFAVGHGAKVINMSLGGAGGFDQAFSDAITNARKNDVVVVVAAGNEANNNDGNSSAVYPCNFTQPNLICVAALDQNYALANFSNFGATSVDVGAPGTNIESTWAGAHDTQLDDFNTGGSLDWTTNGGWGYEQLMSNIGPVDVLVNPVTFPSGAYANSADNRVYKTFDISGNDVATFTFFAQLAIQPGDSLNVNYRSGGGDPFAGGVFLDGVSGTTGGVVGPFSFDISPCIGAACSIGFQLLTDTSGTAQGAGILGFSVDTLKLNATTYNTISGTSMATPEVSGVVAMLRAFNPQYSYADVANAIMKGGRVAGALAGRTTSGRAVDAMGSLTYINPPTGVAAVVVP